MTGCSYTDTHMHVVHTHPDHTPLRTCPFMKQAVQIDHILGASLKCLQRRISDRQLRTFDSNTALFFVTREISYWR